MQIIKSLFWLRQIFYWSYWGFSNGSKDVFLSFDDGPTPKITDWVLQELEKYNAKATFFCLGNNVEKYPEIYQTILECGHTVGNHSYSHLNGWKTKRIEYFNDVQLAGDLIKSDLFRPPYGKIKPSQRKMLIKNYKIVMWDVLCGDYDSRLSQNQCLLNVQNNVKSGSVVLLHDTEQAWYNLQYVLPKILEHFHRKGYCFRAIK